MAWIESHQELARHPKTLRFAHELHVSLPTALGHLHLLWWWSLDYAQDGDLTAFTPVELARAAEYRGTPAKFMAALETAGFIDQDDDETVLHDWDDYAGRLVRRREANAERQRRHRHTHAPSINKETDTLVTRDEPLPNGATVPNPTGPNPTEPDTTQPETFSAGKPRKRAGPNLTPLVDAFRDAGLPDPYLEMGNGTAAQALLRHHEPYLIVQCWKDIRRREYGTDYEREHLTLAYLARNDTVTKWREWDQAGRAPPKRNTNGAVTKPTSQDELLREQYWAAQR